MSNSHAVHLWLRAESKRNEARTALTPLSISTLLAEGFQVSVERSSTRCYSDSEYEATGATLVPNGSWTSAPLNAYIVGLKELEHSFEPIRHTHIYFAHCYKNQIGWIELLHRFIEGKGLIYDLEFLVDDGGRRIAAFGRPAGIAGAAVGLLQWCHQQLSKVQLESGAASVEQDSIDALVPFESEDAMVAHVAHQFELVRKNAAEGQVKPTVMVLGALGRVGTGAVHLLKHLEKYLTIIEWDMAETAKGGPFAEIAQVNILVNAIYLTAKTPPFVTIDFLNTVTDRKLSVIVDVSCDYTSPFNPLPVYNEATSLERPSIRIIPRVENTRPVDVISIDHLPTLLPVESSDNFVKQLLPHIIDLKHGGSNVWSRASKLFEEKSAEAEQASK